MNASHQELVELIDPSYLIVVNRSLELLLDGILRPETQIATEFGVSRSRVKKILATPQVKAYLSTVVDQALKESYLDKLAVIEELKNMAFSNLSDFGAFDGISMHWKEWDQLDRNQLACIESVKEHYSQQGDHLKTEVKLFSKSDALKTLVKMFELSVDKKEVRITHENKPRLFDSQEPIEAEYEEKGNGEEARTLEEAK